MDKKMAIMIVLFLFILWGCTNKDIEKGEFDLRGPIIEVDKHHESLLMEDAEIGLIWISLNDSDGIQKYKAGQDIVVWIDGAIAESYPSQAKALHVEIVQ